MDIDRRIGLLQLALMTVTPLVLGAYAGIMSERAGIINVGIESMMLTSAIVSQLVAMYIHVPMRAAFGNPVIGSTEAFPAAIISSILRNLPLVLSVADAPAPTALGSLGVLLKS